MGSISCTSVCDSLTLFYMQFYQQFVQLVCHLQSQHETTYSTHVFIWCWINTTIVFCSPFQRYFTTTPSCISIFVVPSYTTRGGEPSIGASFVWAVINEGSGWKLYLSLGETQTVNKTLLIATLHQHLGSKHLKWIGMWGELECYPRSSVFISVLSPWKPGVNFPQVMLLLALVC